MVISFIIRVLAVHTAVYIFTQLLLRMRMWPLDAKEAIHTKTIRLLRFHSEIYTFVKRNIASIRKILNIDYMNVVLRCFNGVKNLRACKII